jgi:hypothetical protein
MSVSPFLPRGRTAVRAFFAETFKEKKRKEKRNTRNVCLPSDQVLEYGRFGRDVPDEEWLNQSLQGGWLL